MISDKLYYGVFELAKEERKDAAKNHGEFFNSSHEGYAVLLEEVEEMQENSFDDMNQIMSRIWENVKDDDYYEVNQNVHNVLKAARRTAEEAIQVAAVAIKLSDTIHHFSEVKQAKQEGFSPMVNDGNDNWCRENTIDCAEK